MRLFLFFMIFSQLPNLVIANPRKSVIGSDGTGFFVNYCRVLNHIQHCRLNNQIPVVYWNESSSYYDENGYNGSLNAWEYYFEPVSGEKYEITDLIRRDSYADSDGFSTVGIITNMWTISVYVPVKIEKTLLI